MPWPKVFGTSFVWPGAVRTRQAGENEIPEHRPEYFLTSPYFGKNDFYPYVQSGLKEFDPAGFEMIENLWGVR
jgi:hypothetical protein